MMKWERHDRKKKNQVTPPSKKYQLLIPQMKNGGKDL